MHYHAPTTDALHAYLARSTPVPGGVVEVPTALVVSLASLIEGEYPVMFHPEDYTPSGEFKRAEAPMASDSLEKIERDLDARWAEIKCRVHVAEITTYIAGQPPPEKI